MLEAKGWLERSRILSSDPDTLRRPPVGVEPERNPRIDNGLFLDCCVVSTVVTIIDRAARSGAVSDCGNFLRRGYSGNFAKGAQLWECQKYLPKLAYSSLHFWCRSIRRQ